MENSVEILYYLPTNSSLTHNIIDTELLFTHNISNKPTEAIDLSIFADNFHLTLLL